MRNTVQIPEDISRRIDSLVERSNLSRDQIVEDALSQGRSLAWQEQWVSGVTEGLAEAERGEFASDAEIEAVLNKYGSP
ncbi:ribbon-helix-helix protein, CopG family [Rhizobium sp. AAP116]|uniref:CopG family ribbon-helix-helix protein n=1 Tax=Rhizobium sp. AAP116 TaxID=1523429 RepID=UPI0006B8F079|nr:ribbon-helix-helix protein, CopG family [Rhizobium sp. AAP116]KPF61376.1 transcriptional regulator [Rhizobium sp. AAP116]